MPSRRHGFSSFTYRLYELENKPPGEYLSDVTCLRFGFRPNGRYNDAIFSKVAFSRILKSLDAPQPSLLGILFRGRFYPESGDACEALSGIGACLLPVISARSTSISNLITIWFFTRRAFSYQGIEACGPG